MADIKKAFLNIEVNAEHINYLRFLWYEDISKENPTIIIYRFLRFVFVVTSSPFLLNATINVSLFDKCITIR